MRGDLPDYPWDLMEPYRMRAAEHPDGAVDLSIGSPVDPTPAFVQEALVAAADAHAYPFTVGTDYLRLAIVEWFARRRGVPNLTKEQVIPTVGSKELVALLPFLFGLGAGDTVVYPRVAYPSYEIGALLTDAIACAEDDPALWPTGTKLVWLNSPGNPDGRVLTIEELRRSVSRARELGAVLVSDECYAELGWEGAWASDPIPSLLDPRVTDGDLSGLLVAYSLSKQSNMAGYRTALLAGDLELIAKLANVRKHAGLMLAQPLQAAMAAALREDSHVAQQKERYRARRSLLKPALEAAGFRVDYSDAGLYLWVTEGIDAWGSIAKLADLGIIAGPGPFYGRNSPQHVRLSLTATDERISSAAGRLRSSKP